MNIGTSRDVPDVPRRTSVAAGAWGGSLRAWGPVCFEAIWAPSWIATYLSKTHFQQLGLRIVFKKAFPVKVICWAFQKFLESLENK